MINRNDPEIKIDIIVMKDMLERIQKELDKEYICPAYIKEKRAAFDRALNNIQEITEEDLP